LLTAGRALSSEIVHIKVGVLLQDFGVHKALICHSSPYFKAAFNSGFEETKTGIMKLPDAEPGVFELFSRWLYTESLWSESDDEYTGPMSTCLWSYMFSLTWLKFHR